MKYYDYDVTLYDPEEDKYIHRYGVVSEKSAEAAYSYVSTLYPKRYVSNILVEQQPSHSEVKA